MSVVTDGNHYRLLSSNHSRRRPCPVVPTVNPPIPLLTLTPLSPMFWMCTRAAMAYVLPGRQTSIASIARPRPVVPMVIDVPLPLVHWPPCHPIDDTWAFRQTTLFCSWTTLTASRRRPWPLVPGCDVHPMPWTCVVTRKSGPGPES